jgi:chromosome segregation ATPase
VQLEDLERRLKDTQEEVAERDDNISDLEKKAKETSAKMKQSQSAYEAMRAEKAALAKELAQAQDDIAELKRKEKVQANQIEQLKEDIHAKDRALVAEEFEHQSVEKRLEQRLHEVEQLKKLLEEASSNISKQDAEIVDLNSTIRRLDAEALAQKRAYDQVVTERDILGTQLIRRNDELALLYEKLAIQSATLSKGEAQYKERLEDIRLLKIKIIDLKRELAIAKATEGAAIELKKEMVRLQKQVLQEQSKVKALSEELENPMNVHRWRKLEGSDPATYEMIQKVQTLQRRLIAKTEEVVERDMLITEKDKMYSELKAMLARQPGPEVAEALAHYQHLVVERTRQLKALTSEMNMHQTQLHEYRFEIDRLTRQLLDAKKAYYEVKAKLREYQVAGLVPLSASNSIVANTAGGGASTTGPNKTGSMADAGTVATGSSINNGGAPSTGTKQPPAPVARFVGGGFNVSA